MPNSHLLNALTHFLDHSPHTSLEITFAQHQICNHQNGRLLNRVLKHQSRIIINKTGQGPLAQMEVVDNLLFNFSFLFHQPTAQEHLFGAMLHLPRPLDQGRLEITAEKLSLSFRIDAPDLTLTVHVTQTYYGAHRLRKIHKSHTMPQDFSVMF